MSWQNEMIMCERYLINDVDSPLTYTDNRLQAMLVIAAGFVIPQFNFSQNFTSDANAMTITPDPTLTPTVDEWLVNFILYQAAIMMTRNELRSASNSAVSFKEFHTSVDMKDIYKSKKEILKDFQDVYEKMELQYRIGVRPAGSAIMTPINLGFGALGRGMWSYSNRDSVLFY